MPAFIWAATLVTLLVGWRRAPHHETFAPSIHGSGRHYSCAGGRVAHRMGAILSDPTGAMDRRLFARWRDGYCCAPRWPTIVGAPRSALRSEERRVGKERGGGW